MNILDRYLGRTIVNAILIALLILLGLQSFIEFINELPDLGTKNYGIFQAFLYVSAQLPKDLYQFFPIAGLVGVVMGLGRLASNSELVVMRGAGISIERILGSVFKTAIILLVIVTLIGEYFSPRLQALAETRKTLAMTGQAFVVQPGIWLRDRDSFIRINQILPDNKVVAGIIRYQFANHHLVTASTAELGQYQKKHWVFTNVAESKFTPDRIISTKYLQQIWDVDFNPHFLEMSSIDPQHVSLKKLYAYIQYLKQNSQSNNQLQFQFWQRVFQPLATLVMMGLGVPFVFGPLRSATMGLRIVAGIGVGVSFYVLNQFFGPFSMVYQFPPLWAALIPSLLFALGGGVLLWLTQ